MEKSSKTNQSLSLTLYQQRLQNLQSIIHSLHTTIKGDQILLNLKDPAMQKYRIDRVHEIVVEMLNSQKEKMLIRVLQRYEEQNKKIKQLQINSHGYTRQQEGLSGAWKESKERLENQLSNLKREYKIVERENEEKSKELYEKQKEIEKINSILLQKQKSSPSAFENDQNHRKQIHKLKQQTQLLQSELSFRNQLINKLKKDGEEAVKILQQKLRLSEQKSQKHNTQPLAISPPKAPLENQLLKRGEKIQLMRRQISFLQQQLTTIQKHFNIIKDLALAPACNEIKKLKQSHKKFKDWCIQMLEGASEDIMEISEQIQIKVNRSVNSKMQGIHVDKVMSKLNQMQNQLDYFIENQIIVD